MVIVGPTASGKSRLAVELALAFGGEVLNADSRQVYRGLDIGTAKPTVAERGGVPHHLFDVVGPEETFSAAWFREAALHAAEDVTRRGRLPILVGGTGLYVRALLEGIFVGPARDERTHGRLAAIADRGGAPRLRRWLERVDPESAHRIAPGDRQRVLRALDVYLQSGRPMSDHLRGERPAGTPYRVLKLAPLVPRPLLYERIHARLDGMLAGGFVEEVRRLTCQRGFAGGNAAKAVGYRQIARWLAGQDSLPTAVSLIQRDTRRLAKRQVTWFRRDREVTWIPAVEPECLRSDAEALVRNWLPLSAVSHARSRAEE